MTKNKTTPKFRKPKARYDYNQANDGVWFYPTDEVDNDFGGFRVGLFDQSIPRVRTLAEREERLAMGKQKRTDEDTSRRRNVETILKACLLDWDMRDEDGNEIPFTLDDAIEFFMTKETNPHTGQDEYCYDFVFIAIMNFVRDVRNFQAEDVLGN